MSDGEFDYTYDSANRLTQLTDGTLTTEYEYNGDGVRTAQIADGLRTATGQGRSAYGFAGEEQADGGHLFLRARTYNPETGRFLQQDSVMGDPMQPQSLHRYAYGFSNPVNYTDPSGLMPPINGGPRLGLGNPAAAAYLIQQQSYAVQPGTQVSPQARYTAQVRRPGFNSTHLGRPDGGIPRVRVARSVNGARTNWQPYSDPYARQQSQGQRPAPCGPLSRNPLDPLFAIRDAARGIIDTTHDQVNAFLDDPDGYVRDKLEAAWDWTESRARQRWRQAHQDWQRYKVDPQGYLNHSGAELKQVWRENRETVSLVLDLIPVIGDIKGIIEPIIGYDLAGRQLSDAEKGLMVGAALVGLFTVVDEVIDAVKLANRVADNADEAADLLRASKGLGHLDEGAGLVKHLDDGLLKQAPKVDDRLRALRSLDDAAFRSADDVAASSRLDTFTGGGNRTVSNAAEMRQALTKQSGGATLKERRLATKAWKQSGADLSDPSVRQAIRKGEFPSISGGSGQFDDAKVFVELGAGNYANAIALKKANPDARVIATNLESEWAEGKQVYDLFEEQGREIPDQLKSLHQVKVYEGWLNAKKAGVEVGDIGPLQNIDVPSEIGDVVYSVYPYPSTAVNFGAESARIAKTTPGTIVAVTEAGSGSSKQFVKNFDKARPGTGLQFKVVEGEPYGGTDMRWEDLKPYTRIYEVR